MKKLITLVLFLQATFYTAVANDDETLEMKPLGMQKPAEGHIEILTSVPSADEFFKDYVLPGKPALFRGAAKDIPAYRLWTDEYLKNKFGNIVAVAEEGKKENRSLRTFEFSLEDFVNKYKTEDIYMVHSIPQKMRDDISLLPCISCGGFINLLQDVVLWFSSGGTKSVLHNDGVDNINCLLSGTKDLYMIDKIYEPDAHIDVLTGGYSSVDVDAVNLTKYPNFAKLPWYKAHLEAGDCLFIPFKWLHQVRSFGRNIAVNVWFNHIRKMDHQDCVNSEYNGKYLPMTNVTLKPLEGARNMLLVLMQDKEDQALTKKDLKSFIKNLGTSINRDEFKKIWRLLDKNRDKVLKEDELMSLTKEELNGFNQVIPMYNLNAEEGEEDEGQGDEDRDYRDASSQESEFPGGSEMTNEYLENENLMKNQGNEFVKRDEL